MDNLRLTNEEMYIASEHIYGLNEEPHSPARTIADAATAKAAWGVCVMLRDVAAVTLLGEYSQLLNETAGNIEWELERQGIPRPKEADALNE